MIKITDPEIIRLVKNWLNYMEAIPLNRQMLDMDDAMEIVKKKKDLSFLAWQEIVETYPQIKKDMDEGKCWGIQQNLLGELHLIQQKT